MQLRIAMKAGKEFDKQCSPQRSAAEIIRDRGKGGYTKPFVSKSTNK